MCVLCARKVRASSFIGVYVYTGCHVAGECSSDYLPPPLRQCVNDGSGVGETRPTSPIRETRGKENN